MSSQHEVTLSNGQTLKVGEEESLLEALRGAGIYVKSSCGGHASCSDCLVKITQGEDNLNAPSFEETQLIGNVFHITKERLSCQTKVTGPVSVDISAHDAKADSEKLQTKNKKFIKPKGPIKKRSAEEVQAIKEERMQMKKEKEEKKKSWEKHWEKEGRPLPGKGGTRRPKTFRTDFDEQSSAKDSKEKTSDSSKK